MAKVVVGVVSSTALSLAVPWTEYMSIIALGLGANSENLPVGLGYGMSGRRIGFGSNLFIALATTGATLVPLAIGERLRGYMPQRWPDRLPACCSSCSDLPMSGLIDNGSLLLMANWSAAERLRPTFTKRFSSLQLFHLTILALASRAASPIWGRGRSGCPWRASASCCSGLVNISAVPSRCGHGSSAGYRSTSTSSSSRQAWSW
jgi:hypothetical protein